MIQHAPGILNHGANLQFECAARTGLGTAWLGGAQIQVQTLVAKRRFRAFDGAHFVRHFDDLEVLTDRGSHFFQLVLVQADDAQPDEVTQVMADFVGRATFFQRCTVFARELAQGFLGVFDPPFELASGHSG